METTEKPKSFWQTDTGKIISHVVHDTNGATCSAGSSVSLIKKHLQGDVIDKAYILERLERIDRALERVEKAVDFGYTKFKEKEGYATS